ncbi:MAG TPA: hypothetical protein VJY35_04370 [Candidatus Eisenbacteria bacterium]|nr:hypothetical protein [Candidatus Eisenbacteria bacterium]
MHQPGTRLALVALAAAFLGGCSPKQDTTSSIPPPAAAPDTVVWIARGNEPFWAVEVSPEGIVLREPDRPDGVRGAYTPPAIQGRTVVYRTVLVGDRDLPLELSIEEKACSDGMSDQGYAYTAVARVGDRVLSGCAERRVVGAAFSDTIAGGPPAFELGDWEVVAHRMPGVGAMTEAEATSWHGRIAHYDAGSAAFGPHACHAPSYRSREVHGDSLLSAAYHIAAPALGVPAASTITLIEVRCGGEPWIAPGATLMRFPDGTTYTMWDGTFFEMRHR